MKRIIITSLIGITTLTITPLILPLLPQRSYAQTSNSQAEKLEQLLKKGRQQTNDGKSLEAIKTFQKALAIAREIQDQEKEADAHFGLVKNYTNMGKVKEALRQYDQFLSPRQKLILMKLLQANEGESLETIERFQEALDSVIFHKALDDVKISPNIENESYFLASLRSRDRPEEALNFYNQALIIYREFSDRDGEAKTLRGIGGAYSSLEKTQEALNFYNQALIIYRELSDRDGEAETLRDIGGFYSNLKKNQEALNFYNQALIIYRELSDRDGEAETLRGIGEVYSNVRKTQEALNFYNQALTIYRESRDRYGEAETLQMIGAVYIFLNQPQEVLKSYQQALALTKLIGERRGEATALNGIGGVYYKITKFHKALTYFQQSLAIFQEVQDRRGEAANLNNIGLVYSDIGKSQEALKYYQQALPIKRKIGDRSGQATTLINIGAVYRNISKLQKALPYFQQALLIMQETDYRYGEATALNNICIIYQDVGKSQEALKCYKQALAITREVSNFHGEAGTLNNIGLVYSDIGKPQEALKYYQQALGISRQLSDRSMEATTLSNIGVVYRNSKQPQEAIKSWKESVQITLKMRAGLQKQHRNAFIQDNQSTSVALIDLLIDQHQPNEALKWYNLATTFDLADYTRLIDAKVKNPEVQKLIDQWNQNYQTLQILYDRAEGKWSLPLPQALNRRQPGKNQLLSKSSLEISNEWSPQLSQQINELQAETNQLAADITEKYPEVAELFETTPEDIDKLKANIAPDTVVIQPALLTGIRNVPDSIAIFLVTRDKPTIVKKVPIDAQEFDRLLTEYRAQLENPNADDYDVNQEKLYDYLIRPIETEITAYSPKQLAIIATGKLRYIPFETLYDKQTNQYLIAKYPIHNLTRISATRKQQVKTTKSPTVLAFGNPHPTKKNLPGAEIEAKSIVEKLSGKHYTQEDATLARFKNESLGFPLVHLATHGCFQKEGCPGVGLEANNILFANGESFNIADAALLGLENTDLIVLSACQTAMKADSNGEEIAGVAYLFERAGADAVIASLWNAEDEITKDIMVKFYENVKEGMTKVEALRQAKLDYVRENIHPFYWSPLI
ncbi:MAG: CHAT domain-containing tetratricopeptide repeat protein, partial [Microcoleaceae cyanobacterium]